MVTPLSRGVGVVTSCLHSPPPTREMASKGGFCMMTRGSGHWLKRSQGLSPSMHHLPSLPYIQGKAHPSALRPTYQESFLPEPPELKMLGVKWKEEAEVLGTH